MLFIPASGVSRRPWAVVSGPLSNPQNPSTAPAARLASLGTPSMGQSGSERATRQLPGSDVAPRAQLGRAAPNPSAWGNRNPWTGREGPVCRCRGRADRAGVALLSGSARRYRSCRLCLPTPSPWVSTLSPVVSPTSVPGRFARLINNPTALCSPRRLPRGSTGYLPRGRRIRGRVIGTRSIAAARGPGCLACAEGRAGGGSGHGVSGCGHGARCWWSQWVLGPPREGERSWVLCLGWGRPVSPATDALAQELRGWRGSGRAGASGAGSCLPCASCPPLSCPTARPLGLDPSPCLFGCFRCRSRRGFPKRPSLGTLIPVDKGPPPGPAAWPYATRVPGPWAFPAAPELCVAAGCAGATFEVKQRVR